MSRRLVILVLLIAAVSSAAWLVLASGPSEAAGSPSRRQSVPTRAERSALQLEAVNACRCARRLPTGSGGRETCWAEFNRQLERYAYDSTETYCLPLPTSRICFGSDCIVQSYGNDGVCTSDEARTIEAIYASAPSMEAAGELMERATEGFVRGEPVAAQRTRGGCSG